MTTSAAIMMTVMLSLVWGGFVGFLIKAWRMEEKKRSSSRTEEANAQGTRTR